MLRRRLILALLIGILSLTTPLSTLARQSSEDAELDLSAMMPTPRELASVGLEGYAIRNGWTDTLDQELIGLLTGTFSAGEVEDALDGAGYLRSRITTYDLISADGDAAARRLYVYIDEYAGETGLMNAMDLFLAYPDAEAVETDARIGDDVKIVRYTNVMADSGADATWMALGFSRGNLTAQIIIGDFLTYEPDIEPTAGEIERVAELVDAKMGDVLDDGGPGLSARALRFQSDGDEVVYIEDYYARIDGRTLPRYGDDDVATEDADQTADDAGMIDAYAVEQWLGIGGDYPIDWNVTIRTFDDAGAASDWLQAVPDLAENTEGVRSFRQARDPGLGDEAIAFTYRLPGGAGDDAFAWSDTLVRFDDLVVTISIGRLAGLVPDEILDGLIAAQIECLDTGACSGETAAPDALLDLATSDLEESGGADEAAISGPVAILRRAQIAG